MQNTSTTTASAHVTNYDAFKDSPEIRKGLQITELEKLQASEEKTSLQSIARQIKIGKIIAQGKEFLKTQGAALKAHSISGKLDEILCELYGYKRAYLYMLIAAAKNEPRLSEFEAWVTAQKENGERISVNLPLFAQFVNKADESDESDESKPNKPKKAMQGVRIEYNGKRFAKTEKTERNELTREQITELINLLTEELERQNAAAKLLQSKSENKAHESAKKASSKQKAQPAAIA
jgi:hypothetical protein